MIRIGIFLSLLASLVPGQIMAGTIQYQVTGLGGGIYRYTYTVSGVPLQLNQEIDFKFDPLLYGTLSNPVVGVDFSVIILQPNNPLGTWGDFGALATVNNPSFATPFSIDVQYIGQGTPGSQPFWINQFDSTGHRVSTIDATGVTEFVPEPSTAVLGVTSLALAFFWRRRRRA
jgi:MYXO-CTERM domain-containing protein